MGKNYQIAIYAARSSERYVCCYWPPKGPGQPGTPRHITPITLMEPDIQFAGTLRLKSAVENYATWEILSASEPSLVGINVITRIKLLNTSISNGNMIDLTLTGNFKWRRFGTQLRLIEV